MHEISSSSRLILSKLFPPKERSDLNEHRSLVWKSVWQSIIEEAFYAPGSLLEREESRMAHNKSFFLHRGSIKDVDHSNCSDRERRYEQN